MLNPVMIRSRIALSKNYFSNFSFQTRLEKTNSKTKNSYPLSRPPNILVFGVEPHHILQNYVHQIEKCLFPSCYSVYSISYNKFFSDPWPENTKAIIILNSPFKLNDISSIKTIVEKYLNNGGTVLNFSQCICKMQTRSSSKLVNFSGKLSLSMPKEPNSPNVDIVVSRWNGNVIESANENSLLKLLVDNSFSCVASFSNKENTAIYSALPLVVHDDTEGNKSLFLCSYLLHCLGIATKWNGEAIALSETVDSSEYVAYLFATDFSVQKDFLQRISTDISEDHSFVVGNLKFVSSSYNNLSIPQFSDNQIRVIYSNEAETSSHNHQFNWGDYKSNLFSQKYGKLVIYGDLLPTTMDVFDGILSKLSAKIGPVAIARQQTKGQGRGSNKWLSPLGCAMFTLVVHIPVHSHLGKALPFLQHLTTVAVVHAVRTIAGLQDVNLTVKWPNDIYFGSSTKLGGVIVKSTILHDICIASIGCGVNVANSKPTVCINDILKDEYCIMRQLSCEEVIAKTLTQLELLINDFQMFGSEVFTQLYYKYWLHSNAEVKIEVSSSVVCCTIVGIDEFGFLLARRHDNGTVLSLHPDGNSFDIMHNLIAIKKS